MKNIIMKILEFISEINTKIWVLVTAMLYVVGDTLHTASGNSLFLVPSIISVILLIISTLIGLLYIIIPIIFKKK